MNWNNKRSALAGPGRTGDTVQGKWPAGVSVA